MPKENPTNTSQANNSRSPIITPAQTQPPLENLPPQNSNQSNFKNFIIMGVVIVIIILLATGIFYTYCTMSLPPDKISLPIKDFWAIIAPLITLAISYLFGDKIKKNGA